MSDLDDSKPTSHPKRPRRTPEERLAAARAGEERAAARLARKRIQREKYEAVQKGQVRKLDTRRKIIAGALALEHMRHDAGFAATFRALLNTYVTKEPERALFGLDTSPAEPIAPAPTTVTATPASMPAAPVQVTVPAYGGWILSQPNYAPLHDPASYMRRLGTK